MIESPLAVVLGMLLDAKGQIAIALLSEEAVGVSVERFDDMPSKGDLHRIINSERWVTVSVWFELMLGC